MSRIGKAKPKKVMNHVRVPYPLKGAGRACPRLVCRTGHHANSALKANAVRRYRAGNPIEGHMHLRTHGPTLGDNTVKCRVPRRDVRLPLDRRSKRVSAFVDDLVQRLDFAISSLSGVRRTSAPEYVPGSPRSSVVPTICIVIPGSGNHFVKVTSTG